MDTAAEYKTVAGFSAYRVGTDGSCWSMRRGEWERLSGSIEYCGDSRTPYRKVKLSQGGRSRREFIHTLVLETFIGPRPAGTQARHLNGRSLDNSVGNLAWGTSKDNHEDMKRLGRKPMGSSHYASRLTEESVAEARRLRAEGHSYPSLARRYGVTKQCVRNAIRGKTWKHVTIVPPSV